VSRFGSIVFLSLFLRQQIKRKMLPLLSLSAIDDFAGFNNDKE